MATPFQTRRGFTLSVLASALWCQVSKARRMPSDRAVVTDFGAVADGITISTGAIQSAVDHVAKQGGGTVVVPSGTFVSGALFLKPGVNLHLDRGAVLRCSNAMENFPRQRTRIEGHFEPNFTPALINADGCHGLRITGQGTLDGAGRPIWDRFWAMRAASPDPTSFPNVGLDRARLAIIENAKGVVIDGITFKDSQFWNLHIYRCDGVQVRNVRFEVPDDYKQAPSTDGIDLDSSRNIVIDGCYFSVTDDCIAAKGSKGPRAMADTDSPPVENIRIRRCHFRRGHQAFTCGSEATIVRNVIMEDCTVTGAINLLMLKLRPDTPQRYEDIHVRNITLDSVGGRILLIEPWSQYKDLGGVEPPTSTVRNITLHNIRGRFGSFGIVRPNVGQTTIDNIRLTDIRVRLTVEAALAASGATGIVFDRVVINDEAVSAPGYVTPDPAANAPTYRVSG